MIEVLRQIAEKRSAKIKQLGFALGHEIPKQRTTPLCPPRFSSPLLIAEIKRASPSSGKIGEINDPVKLARFYLDCGAGAISVLTEEDHFQGSITDLVAVKNAHKNATILRKDFLQFKEEAEISYRMGADMVLVIIAMFLEDRKAFEALLLEILSYKLTPLFEIHNQEELDFILPYEPQILGINMRSLHSFEIHKQKGILLKEQIPKGIKTIFESGIESDFDGYMIGACGFDGMLCGSYFVKNQQNKLSGLISSYQKAQKNESKFYAEIFQRLTQNPPLIKICGITNLDDALLACKMGADMLGFIFPKSSPRHISIKAIKQISRALKTLYPHVLKIGVLLEDDEDLRQAKELCAQNLLDALQLHAPSALPYFGKEDLTRANFNHYICINYEKPSDFPSKEYLPFVLLDSKSAQKGGSGKAIDLASLETLAQNGQNLFVSGGIGPDNVESLLDLGVKMLDINSKIEGEIGRKDPTKMQEVFAKIHAHRAKNSKNSPSHPTTPTKEI